MATINLVDAQAHLPEIISRLNPGEGLVIVQSGEAVATLTRTPVQQWPCKAGSAKATEHWMAPDFNAPLDEFREHME
jgi:antitoxin (DNA-binding transcriptional repressor) of toxin-antitoxin stability system